MDKSPAAFRTISEVSEALDVPAHVLRFWEQKFPQIRPVKRGGGRRYYRPEDVALLVGIRELLYDDGLTIKGVQKVLRERGQRHVVARGAEAAGETLGFDFGEAEAAGAEAEAPVEAEEAEAAPEAEPAAAPAPGAEDAERIRAAISRLEALRDRLRGGT